MNNETVGVSLDLDSQGRREFNIWNNAGEDCTVNEEEARRISVKLIELLNKIDEAAQ